MTGRVRSRDDPGVVEYDGGLRLTGSPLWLDAHRPVSLSFLSHATAFRRHQRVITSPDTMTLLGDTLEGSDPLVSPLGRRFSVGELSLELLPAGSVVGSALLLMRHRGRDVLYCGAVRLGSPWLGERAQVPEAEVLVLNCPYDAQPFVFPSRRRVGRELVAWIRPVVEEGGSPVLVASALGTAQELCQLLSSEGFPPPKVDRAVSQWNRRVRACGQPLAKAPELRRPLKEGEIAVVSHKTATSARLLQLAPRARKALVSGRAVLAEEVARAGAEVGFALSCQADAKALRTLVRDSGARHVYLGPRHTDAFETTLRRSGIGVTRFGHRPDLEQLELFR